MTTNERINGKNVTIEWNFEKIEDRLSANWAQWRVEGEDENGNTYQGNCFAEISDPTNNFDDDVTDIELIKEEDYDLPANWEPDYNGSSAAERQEEAYNIQHKLK